MKGKENPGWFRRGPDPRRHRLTPAERRRGGLTRARQWLAEIDVQIYGYSRFCSVDHYRETLAQAEEVF